MDELLRIGFGELVEPEAGQVMKKPSLGVRILIGIAVGLAIGFLSPRLAAALTPVGDVFLRMLKMLMVPLVFFCIASGVCKMGDVRQLRTVGVRFLLYIVLTSGACALVGVAAGLLTGVGSGTREFVNESATVARTPFVRFSFASSDESLKKAVGNIRAALSKIIK